MDDYFRQRDFKDCTFLLHEQTPVAWDAQQMAFEGEGGLHAPSAVQAEQLGNHDAHYETPAAALQYRLTLDADAASVYRFAFGPAKDDAEIAALRARYLSKLVSPRRRVHMRTICRPAVAAFRSQHRMRRWTIWSTTGCRARCSITATSIA